MGFHHHPYLWGYSVYSLKCAGMHIQSEQSRYICYEFFLAILLSLLSTVSGIAYDLQQKQL